MPRPLDNFTPDTNVLSRPREPLLTLDLSVVTPLFGGGAVPREVDPERPVSAKSVRGHLRFWWRACRGAGHATPEDLFVAEAKIWGSTDCPGAVEVVVSIQEKGREIRFDQWRDGLPRYALFPFHPQRGDQGQPSKPGVSCLKDVRFKLIITGPKPYQADVEAAVWAWVLFGGVGARTRRGCGTLFCPENPFGHGVMVQARKHVLSGERTALVPSLVGGKVLVSKEMGVGQQETPEQAWSIAVRAMQEFRQGLGFGRRKNGNRPTRSYWPEADSIRDLTNSARGRVLNNSHPPAEPARPFFPRADLGLPIVFHFKDEPYGETLLPLQDKMARMASPVILKALPLSESSAVPMAVMLETPHVWDGGRAIGFKGGTPLNAQMLDQSADPSAWSCPSRNGRVKPLGGKNIRDAFWDFTKGKWATVPGRPWDGQEVTLP